jgi:hypothetical protein
MKKMKILIPLILGILLLSTLAIPALAGVEPSPFRLDLKKLGNVENKLESYQTKLVRMTNNLPGEDETVKSGDIGKFWHLARDINRQKDKTEKIIMGLLPEQDPLPTEIQAALSSIKADANELNSIISPYLELSLPEDIIIAMTQVSNSALAMVSMIDGYLV